MSPQTAEIYQLLVKSQALTAAQIGKTMRIFPHSVYRSMQTLEDLGLVVKSQSYPAEYSAKPLDDALSLYLNVAREHFLEKFFSIHNESTQSSTKAASNGLQLSFIKNRQDMLDQSNQDVWNAKKEIVMIFSGLIASAETILAYKRAVERGVKIRFIVQRLDETNKEMLRNWEKLGVEVRYYPLIEARILLFDSRVAYIVSYNQNVKEEGIGVRFEYAPVAILMEELFEKRWKRAKVIK